MILFLDLETTGLRPNYDRVLEIGAFITDDRLSQICQDYHRTLRFDPKEARIYIDPVVMKMHTENGLWDACLQADGSIERSDAHLVQRILECYGSPDEPVLLAGNSVHFDRAFMEVHLPRTFAMLHYREIDITTMNEMARRFWPEVYAKRPAPGKVHRAYEDAYESLTLARYYAGHSLTPSPK